MEWMYMAITNLHLKLNVKEYGLKYFGRIIIIMNLH